MSETCVAALYVDPKGPYPGLIGVENCWDEARDARKYSGPYPVVAHPPCGPWGSLSHMAIPSERRCRDADCMQYAVTAVRKFKGVLEQPAKSKAFRAFGMPHPGERPDEFGGETIEVYQCEWGHVARKRTWLYIVGDSCLGAPPFPSRVDCRRIGSAEAENMIAKVAVELFRTASRFALHSNAVARRSHSPKP